MAQLKITRSFTLGGVSFPESRTIVAEQAINRSKDAVAAAVEGALTTRTSASVGTLTMDPGHGITTGSRIDIYWTDAGVLKRRYGVTVGTVATNDVPITGGAGDDLPADESDVIVGKCVEGEMRFDGDDCVAVVGYSGARGCIVLATAGGDAYVMDFEDAARTAGWVEGSGVSNPIAGDVITKAYFSHANTAASKAMRVGAMVD